MAYIRSARPDDAPSLADLHVTVWRQTYRELAPQEAIDRLDGAHRLPYWQHCLNSDAPLTGAYLAENQDAPLGVISFGPGSHPAFGDRLEIKHLYVAAPARRLGLGRQLLQSVFDHALSHGQTRICLAVVKENERARAAYKRLGGREETAFTDPGPLWRSNNIVVAWQL